MRSLFISLLIASVVCCTGCSSVYTGGGDDSPDGKYYFAIQIVGAPGHSFLDQTRKTVFISIETKGHQTPTIVTNYQNGVIASETVVAVSGPAGKPLLEKKYHLQGSDVCCDDVWGKDDNVTLYFYDYGPGVYWEDGKKNGIPKREIQTFHYVLDSRSGRFVDDKSATVDKTTIQN